MALVGERALAIPKDCVEPTLSDLYPGTTTVAETLLEFRSAAVCLPRATRWDNQRKLIQDVARRLTRMNVIESDDAIMILEAPGALQTADIEIGLKERDFARTIDSLVEFEGRVLLAGLGIDFSRDYSGGDPDVLKKIAAIMGDNLGEQPLTLLVGSKERSSVSSRRFKRTAYIDSQIFPEHINFALNSGRWGDVLVPQDPDTFISQSQLVVPQGYTRL